MKHIFSISVFIFSLSILYEPADVFGQKETFDLVTYTLPKAWKKQTTENAVQLSKENAAKGTYCLITVLKSVPGTPDSKENFDAAWTTIVKEMVTVSSAPEMQPSATESGWEVQSGYAPFESDGNKGIVLLVTSSGFEKMINVIILTNTDVYEKDVTAFIESVSLAKPVSGTKQTVTDIAGVWGKTASARAVSGDPAAEGLSGYTKDQYTFLANGSYTFISKTFGMSYNKILLVKENGVYQVNGAVIAITPQKSVIEAWSKKDGGDKWGKLLSTQNRKLEKATYTFTRHYFSGIQQWNLVLQPSKVTERDGPFSNNKTFTNAYYYAPVSSTNPVVELPDAKELSINEPIKAPATQTTSNGFTFTTTNFDDGWTSTVQEDWVQVTKGSTKVLIHYPSKKTDEYLANAADDLKRAWENLVAPKYNSITNAEFKIITGWQYIYFAEADATEKISGKNVHVVLFKYCYSNGSGKYLEFITTDKASFEKEFCAYHQNSGGWEKVENMVTYNKFAVAAADLKGTWTTKFTGTLQYVNAYTGADAGMDSHASNEKYEFGPGNTYKWDLGVASGRVGSIKFQSVKSNGKFSVPNNWQINFSDIEGKPRAYNASFSCIKGLRILWIDGNAFGKTE